MEWKWYKKCSPKEIDTKWNDGMEIEWKKILPRLGSKIKQSGMEMEWKWNREIITNCGIVI